jgi:hypothetical protein
MLRFLSGTTRIVTSLVLATGAFSHAQNAPAVVALAGNNGIEEFKDTLELSDGTILLAGSAENLDWIAAPKTELPPLVIPHRNTGRTAFVMRVSADLATILGAWHLPPGQAHDFRWIKTTSPPGSSTGAIYLSGSCDTTSGDYFIARLDANFIAAAPTGFSWTRVAKSNNTHGANLGLQTWDVGGDGRTPSHPIFEPPNDIPVATTPKSDFLSIRELARPSLSLNRRQDAPP